MEIIVGIGVEETNVTQSKNKLSKIKMAPMAKSLLLYCMAQFRRPMIESTTQKRVLTWKDLLHKLFINKDFQAELKAKFRKL